MQQKHQAEVHVITVGEVSCEPVLRECLAIGAQIADRIDCPATDGNAVARELAAHCKNESYDLIIAGRESIDYNGGMVGGLLAALLGYDFVTNCIRLDIENSTATLSREIDGGIEHLSSASLGDWGTKRFGGRRRFNYPQHARYYASPTKTVGSAAQCKCSSHF